MLKKLMMFVVPVAFFLALGVPASAQQPLATDGDVSIATPFSVDGSLNDYRLVWHDEFNGNAVDTSQWDYRTGPRLLSFNRTENVSEGDGVLRIALKQEQIGNLDYTSGGIISKKTFKYGYYEARFKCALGEGWHTSFWTSFVPSAKLPNSDEIDICEQDSVHHNVYSSGVIDWSRNQMGFGRVYYTVPADLSLGYHVWGCEFTPSVINFYFDGKLTNTIDATKFPTSDSKIWLTAVAVLWHGSTKIDDVALPDYALFDWVRFYQKQSDD